MAADLGKAYIQIMPSAKGISGSITKAMSGESVKAGEAAGTGFSKKFGAVAVKAIGALGIGKLIGDAVTKGADLEQSLGGIETLYGKAAKRMQKSASKAWRVGISQNDYQEQAVMFGASLKQALGGDVKKAAKEANKAIIDMADNSAKFGTNIESIKETYQSLSRGQYQLLDNLRLGYGGTKSEMERLLADAQKLTGVKYDINNFSDVIDAIHVVQDELGIAGTAGKEASETISGSLQQVKASWENLLANAALGNDIKPQAEALAESLYNAAKNVLPAIGNVIAAIPETIWNHRGEIAQAMKDAWANIDLGETLNGVVKSAVDYTAENLPALLDSITAAINKYVDSKGEELKTKLSTFELDPNIFQSKGQSTARTFFSGVLMEGAAGFAKIRFGLIKAILMTVASLAVDIVRVAGSIGTSITTAIANAIGNAWGEVAAAVKRGTAQTAAEAAADWANLKTATANAWAGIKNAVATKVSEIKGVVNFSSLGAKVTAAFNAVKSAITKPLTAARDAVAGIVKKIKGAFPLRLGKVISLSLPRIDVGSKFTSFAGKSIKVPTFRLAWHAKGGIVDDPTILHGIGEAGAEAIVPLDPFWQRLEASQQREEEIEKLDNMVYLLSRLLSVTTDGRVIKLNRREIGRATGL